MRKLGRTSSQRKALLRDLATTLILNERITTTESKAKELRPVVEKLITLGKRGTVQSKYDAAAFVRPMKVEGTEKTAVSKLFDELAPRFADRQGGYTRIVKLPARTGDNAPMAMIEFVDAK